jgi:hypothetical protein
MVVALIGFYIAAASWLGTTLELDVSVLARVQGMVIPLLTGLITKKVASSRLKAFCTAMLSLLGSVVAVAIAADGKVVLGDWVDTFVTTLVTATATYYGFWKPTGTAEAVQDIAPTLGLGSEPDVPETDWEHRLFMLLEDSKENLYKRAVNLQLPVNTKTTKRELADAIIEHEKTVKPFPL